MLEPSFQDYQNAKQSVSNTIRHTPIDISYVLSEKFNHQVFIKQEHTQITGSFKLRGACNALLNLSSADKKRGVIGVSTGNYGKALAYAAYKNDIPCTICMSNLVPQNKIDGIKRYNADVVIHGTSQDEAEERAKELAQEKGYMTLHPFDHLDVIAGQGTIGLELLEQVPTMKHLIVQVSGGGLLCGIAAAIKSVKPEVVITAVSMQRGAAMYESLQAQKPVWVKELPTLADSLGGGIGLDNQYTFAMMQKYIDEFLLVNERQIADAIRFAYKEERQASSRRCWCLWISSFTKWTTEINR